MPTPPIWLKPANTLASLEGGARAGEADARIALEAQHQAQQMAMAQQRTVAEMERARMEMDVRQKTQEQEALKEAQRIKIDGAYKEQQLGLQQERLKQASELAAAKAKQAAAHFAAQQGYATARAAGKSNEQALWENPGLITAGTMSATTPRSPIPRFDTITERTKIPATEAVDEVKPVPAHKEGFWGFRRDVPASSGSPARPASLERTITKSRKVPSGSSEESANGPTQSDIDVLLKMPEKAASFDKKFGAGSAAQILQPENAQDEAASEE